MPQGGIIIQRDYGTIGMDSTSRENIPRSSSLNMFQIISLNEKRATVDLRNALEGTDISEQAHEKSRKLFIQLVSSFSELTCLVFDETIAKLF